MTWREAGVDNIDQEGCKIGGQRGFITASRTQSDHRKVYNKHEWPQFGCKRCYKFTHLLMEEYAKEVVASFVEGGLDPLCPFYHDLREKYILE